MDIIIPLAGGSRNDDLELRYALRSIEKNVKNVGTVFLVTESAPRWFRRGLIIPCGDPFDHCKDNNLWLKLNTAAQYSAVDENFLFWSDDQVALNPFNANASVAVYNPKTKADFEAVPKKSRWQERMIHTFNVLEENAIKLKYNFDSHVPQPMMKYMLNHIPAPDDCCICTYVYGMGMVTTCVNQNDVKITAETDNPPNIRNTDKLFLGYNNVAFDHGIREQLEQMFPNKSKFEA